MMVAQEADIAWLLSGGWLAEVLFKGASYSTLSYALKTVEEDDAFSGSGILISHGGTATGGVRGVLDMKCCESSHFSAFPCHLVRN
jgi:hypothetical protein